MRRTAEVPTKAERHDILVVIRQRAKVARSQTEARASELLAEFQRQLATIYKFDDDEIWKAAYEEAESVARVAQRKVAERCRVLGIPAEFAPRLDVHWYGRGENAVKDRRAELERVAKAEIDALKKRAYARIEEASVKLQEEVIATGITTDGGKELLSRIPTPEELMPPLKLKSIEQKLDAAKKRGGRA